MNALDVIIIAVVVFQAYFWAQKGLNRGLFSLGGFWLGLIFGAWLAPEALKFAGKEPGAQLLFALASTFGFALIGQMIGRAIGLKLGNLAERLRLEKVDGVLGAVFGVVMTLAIAWLAASILSGMPLREANRQIRDSSVIHALNDALPPAPDVISKIAGLINTDGFPQVFEGLEPRPIAPVNPPTSGEVAALKAAGRSTVRIEGSGCGGIVTGSGFVASPNIVVTNAHVVAGIARPVVVDAAGRHPATPLLFEPDLDIAILRAEGVSGGPLNLAAGELPRGTAATVLGYPGGGPLEADAAGVLRSLTARGRNIYGNGLAVRPVYELQTAIEQGNSGGPVVLADGTVIGVIFAQSQSAEDIGYAVTSPEIIPLLARARGSKQAVGTGTCTP